MPERVAYRRAFDQGRSATETPFASLTEKADAMAQAIIDLINKAGEHGKDSATETKHEGRTAAEHASPTSRQSRPART